VNKKLSAKTFSIALLLLFFLALTFLGTLYYVLNIQFAKPNNPFSTGPVTTVPKTLSLDVNSPDDNSLVYQSSILVTGKASPGYTVLVSGDGSDSVTDAKLDGSFSTSLNLVEGVNNVTIAVFDKTGEEKSITRTIYYSKEKL
jgi:hypothetical protein